MMKKTTNKLTEILKKTSPEKIDSYFSEYKEEVLEKDRPFPTYIRTLVKEKNLHFQDVFLHADLSEGYGYKLVSGEKHTRQRDTIIKLCLGAACTLNELQRGLKIYGMSPLYARFPRDAILISAISSGIYDLAEINKLLKQHGQPLLRGSEEL